MTAAAYGQLHALQGHLREVLPPEAVPALPANCLAPGLGAQLHRHKNLSVGQYANQQADQ